LSGHGESIAEFAAPADADGLRALARRVRGQRVRAVIESMDGARFVHDTLEEAGWEVLVADAQAISGAAIHERRAPAMPARAARRQGARSTPGRLCGPYALARSSSVPESRFLGTEPGTVTRPVSPRTLKEHVPMITSAISSAARLSLAPARLAGQMAGALLRGLRGKTSRDTSSARRSAGAPARRSRAQVQTKRSATRSSGKRQPKRTAARARAKGQPSAARPKGTAAGTSAQARPTRADRTEPLGDVAITREVESTIFRDLEADRGQVDVKVAEGVVRLRGEVRTPDLIRELEARAARVPQVRRVENLLRTPAPPPQPATPAAQQVDPASTPGKTSGAPAPASTVRATSMAGVAQGAEPPLRPEGDESADHDEPGDAEPDMDPNSSRGTGGPHGPQGS
jgi:osmotically-inducible protein OsmY